MAKCSFSASERLLYCPPAAWATCEPRLTAGDEACPWSGQKSAALQQILKAARWCTDAFPVMGTFVEAFMQLANDLNACFLRDSDNSYSRIAHGHLVATSAAVTATATAVSAAVAAVLARLGLVHGECPAAVLLTV
jgi:hypothetical protein